MKTPNYKSWIIGCVLALYFICNLNAQAPVDAILASYMPTTTGIKAYTATPATNSGTFTNCVKQTSNYSFNNGTQNGLLLTNIVVKGYNYSVANKVPAIIKLRRVNNQAVKGNRSIIFLESTTGPAQGCPSSRRYDFKSPYQDNMENFLNNNYINQGTDNIFTNNGNSDGNNNNIERVDVIFKEGISSSSAEKAGFALFDRGVENAHDPFRIAAIIAIDANGNPTAFGPVRTCIGGNGTNNGSWGHPSLVNGNRDLSVYVMRKEAAEAQLRSSAAINQQLGGVFFSFADLGVMANQVIYGYALLSVDGVINPTSRQLLNVSDQSVYPLNTNEAVGGGLDLIAVNAFFLTGETLISQGIQLKGNWQGEKAVLHWSLEALPAASRAELQHSQNGIDFITIRSFVVPGSYSADTYTDPVQGYPYYRLKIETPEKQVLYSRIIQIKGVYLNVQLYPTRIQPSQAVRIKGIQDGVYTVVLTSSLGATYIATVKIQNGTGLIEAPLGGFTKGFYYVAIKGTNTMEGGAKLVVY